MAVIALQVLTNEESVIRTRLNKIPGASMVKTFSNHLSLKDNQARNANSSVKECFPGYILVDIAGEINDVYHAIKETPGVIRVLEGIVTLAELAHIRNIATDKGVIEVKKDNMSTYDILQGIKERITILKTTTLGWFRKIVTRRCDKYEFPLHLFTMKEIIDVDIGQYETNQEFADAISGVIGEMA